MTTVTRTIKQKPSVKYLREKEKYDIRTAERKEKARIASEKRKVYAHKESVRESRLKQVDTLLRKRFTNRAILRKNKPATIVLNTGGKVRSVWRKK